MGDALDFEALALDIAKQTRLRTDALNSLIEREMGREHINQMDIKDYIDARDEATRAVLDKDLSRLEGKIDAIPGRGWFISTMSTVVATGFAVVGLVAAIMSYGGDQFGSGASINKQITDAQKDSEAKIEGLRQDTNSKFNAILDEIRAQKAAPQPPKKAL